jgi:hypothetical protein
MVASPHTPEMKNAAFFIQRFLRPFVKKGWLKKSPSGFFPSFSLRSNLHKLINFPNSFSGQFNFCGANKVYGFLR